jgi:N-acetylneuraminic acid mutarotase
LEADIHQILLQMQGDFEIADQLSTQLGKYKFSFFLRCVFFVVLLIRNVLLCMMCVAPLAAQIGKYKRRVRELQELRLVTFNYTEKKEFVEIPVNRFVKVAWFDTLVMYWCPDVTQTVPRCEVTVEMSVLTKSRQLIRPYMYAVGGEDTEGCSLPSVECYDEEKDQWKAVANMSIARYSVGVGVLGGCLYAVGGYANGYVRLSSVERYDKEKDQWESVASMNSARAGLGVGVMGGRLYAVGGIDKDIDGFLNLSLVERYDEGKDKWEVVTNMNSCCGQMGVCVLDGLLYAVGGKNDYDQCLSSVERYDEGKDEWEPVANMNSARCNLGVAVLDGRMYAMGGLDSSYNYVTSVERYDEKKDEWEVVSKMICKRSSAGCCALGGSLYVVGGISPSGSPMNSVERYDEGKDEWEVVASTNSSRFDLGVAAIEHSSFLSASLQSAPSLDLL